MLLLLMTVSAVGHLTALHRDLPLHDTDEEFFVEPAVHMAATGDLNPHWFGHPGSTVIYPIAFLIHGWDAVANGGPLLLPNHDLTERNETDPTEFYVIGRLWTIALGVATLPALFALGRRAFNTAVGLIAAALWAVLPFPMHFARIVRSDSAATFFGVLALWCCVRALQESRPRWWVCAGIAVGFAASSRYFMVALIPCMIAAAVLPNRRDTGRAMTAVGVALTATIAAFIVSTPYFFLDARTAWRTVNAENTTSHPVAEGLSRLGNARWYIGDAIPASVTWPIFVSAIGGVVLVLVRRRAPQLLLLLFCSIFLVGISFSKLHWQRWAIEMLPVLLLFAALTIHEVSKSLGGRSRRPRRAIAIAAVALTALVAVAPVKDSLDRYGHDGAATTRTQSRDWIRDNLPDDSRVLQWAPLFNVQTRTIPPVRKGVRMTYGIDPPTRTVAEYRSEGYDVVVVAAGEPFHSVTQRDADPVQRAFYMDLACTTRLVASFQHSATRGGPGIHIYRLDQGPVALLDYFCRQPDPSADAAARARTP